ncbi:hypothetical protein K1T71_005799 [Dendrolimus kikuchii]|uniref:Uncharacterized protein n=1 Tax=Dendrolimus kikuchii TaxID=765133 RepID=A0ACC1D522_9NEOP|nr:hypothetical protein K1T71_005799 [Dendrolimus kikuchii]
MRYLRTLVQTRNITYYETYTSFCFGDNSDYEYGIRECMKKREKWSTKLVTVTDYGYKTVQICCPGYVLDDDVKITASESIKCKPICRVHCENGFCEEPNVCNCREGYRKKRTWYGTLCEPVCESNCINGKCVSPNACECNHGYASLNGTCEPVCSDPCINGDCTAPEICECLPGYEKSNLSICEPHCSTGCEHGECVAPETCRCDPGWIKANNTLNIESCMPVCNEICNSQTCVPPDTCVCKPGYVKTGRNECNFYCSKCVYGKCVDRETCTCFKPLVLNEDRTDCVSEISVSVTDLTELQMTVTDVTVITEVEAMIITDTTIAFNESLEDIYWLDKHAESITTKEEGNRNWLYILLGILVFLIVMSIIMLIIYKKKILRHFKGTEYIVEDRPKHDVRETLVDVTFSSLKKEGA